MAIQKREYELSVWHESLNYNGIKEEQKLAVIGAHDMSYLGRATGIKFQTKLNGTHQLIFQMPDKFFDNEKGEFVQNEFKDFVVNENKVKLFYKNEWYEFFVKTVKDIKHFKSFIKSYTCTDAFIDELSRNGYGITYDGEAFNNVKEIGNFTTEILEESQWSYSPKNNWGDFTEYTEEKLFRIPVSCFGGAIKGYKLQYEISSEQIENRFTGEKRNMELGDDLAKDWFWDSRNSKNIPLLNEVITIPNDGYIYVPYSQLDFCYVTTSGNGNIIVATEEPYSGTFNGIKSYLLAPKTIDPSALIQFIAIPQGAEVEIDEAGLLVNKNYHYIMTVEQWNQNCKVNYWYTKDITKDSSGDYEKKVEENKPSNYEWFYNRAVVYDGYLNQIGELEVKNGKKISISNRTVPNISEEINSLVTVYNNKSEEFTDSYINPAEWYGNAERHGYYVCSRTSTRLISPQLARNYFENGLNFQSTNGWEIAKIKELTAGSEETSAKIELKWNDDESDKKAWLNFIHSEGSTGGYYNNLMINFGAIGQEKIIEKGKVYCFGIKTTTAPIKKTGWKHPNSFFLVGKGSIDNNGNYVIDGFDVNEETIDSNKVLQIELQSKEDENAQDNAGQKNQFYLIKADKTIENPYLCLYFTTSIIIEEVWFFEAYTKGQDQFDGNNIRFKYSGRDYLFESNDILGPFTKANMLNKVIFETDIMRGDVYEYEKYFIQQLRINNEYKAYDTFNHQEYTSVDSDSDNSLPLSASKYTSDDYKILTNYIDLNKCKYYKGNTSPNDLDCKYDGTAAGASEPKHFCMYQKYGYCPYRFTTEKHCRKVRTLTGAKSNRFNLTQEIGKTFEVYPVYYTEHNSNGSIKYKEVNGTQVPIKDIFYITEKGMENKIGFRYEKNLSDIDRTIVSDQIVTKLYVEDNDSELSKTGMCSIKTAEDNPSKDNFIIDLSYYIKQGMLDEDQVYKDLYGTEKDSLGFLKRLGYYNTQYQLISNKIINLTNQSFGELESNTYVDITGIKTAQKEVAKIKKKMSHYKIEGQQEDNKVYQNYKDELSEYQSILGNLWYELLDANGTNQDIDQIEKDFKEKNFVGYNNTKGMLGQYIKEYSQIQEWKKLAAKYLKDINTVSSEFYKYYEPYLKEGTWTDSNYLTDNAYYQDALAVAAQGAIPKVSYNIRVIPLGLLDEDYNIGVADTTYVEDIGMFDINKKTGLPNRLKVIISELNESLDVPTEDSITVQNFTTQFEDLFQQVTASVQSLTFNENIYKRSSNFTANQNIKNDSLQGALDTNDLVLLNTHENNIKLDAEGQSGSDINNHNNKYKLNGQGLWFSNNGGETWNVGVGPGGINADYINAGTLDSGRIRIIDNNYIYFMWDKDGITAYREPEKVNGQWDGNIGKDFARFNKYGLSLVENDQIRLRAGYSFNGNSGKIGTEEKLNNEIGFYLYDEEGNAIFKTETGDKSARLSLAGEIFAAEKLDDTSTDDTIGVFLYNQSKYKARESNYNKRLFSILQEKPEGGYEFDNILSVLDDGALYIGGKANAYTKYQQGVSQTNGLVNAGEFLKIDSSSSDCIKLVDGKIWFGDKNLYDEIEDRIDEIEREVREKGLIRHNHTFTVPERSISSEYTGEIEYSGAQTAVIRIKRNEDDSYMFNYFKGPSGEEYSQEITNACIWISDIPSLNRKDEFNIYAVHLKDFIESFIVEQYNGATNYSGDNSGGTTTGYYLEDPLQMDGD